MKRPVKRTVEASRKSESIVPERHHEFGRTLESVHWIGVIGGGAAGLVDDWMKNISFNCG